MIALFLHAFARNAERLPRLRARGDARAHRAVDGRHFDLRAADRFTDGHGKVDVDVVAAPLVKRMRPDVHQDVEIARRPARHPGDAFAAQADALAVRDSLGDL